MLTYFAVALPCSSHPLLLSSLYVPTVVLIYKPAIHYHHLSSPSNPSPVPNTSNPRSPTASLTPPPSRHLKSHTHPQHCPHCARGFETTKDVNRHINDVHKTTKKYFCTFEGCKYAREGGRGFPRKENWRRHVKGRCGVVGAGGGRRDGKEMPSEC
jgi:hypothetical protein